MTDLNRVLADIEAELARADRRPCAQWAFPESLPAKKYGPGAVITEANASNANARVYPTWNGEATQMFDDFRALVERNCTPSYLLLDELRTGISIAATRRKEVERRPACITPRGTRGRRLALAELDDLLTKATQKLAKVEDHLVVVGLEVRA